MNKHLKAYKHNGGFVLHIHAAALLTKLFGRFALYIKQYSKEVSVYLLMKIIWAVLAASKRPMALLVTRQGFFW